MSQVAAQAIRGDLLSCYTASIATYMAQHAIDYELVLGTQIFLAVRPHPASPALDFMHYHTPLIGDTATHSLRLARKSATRADDGCRSLITECKRHGGAIVAGDTMRLPWLLTCGRKHAPHWFVITALDEQAGTADIIDPFDFTDEHGSQTPFEGQIDLSRLGSLAQANPIRRDIYLARARAAFGCWETQDSDIFTGYHWFEASCAPVAHRLDEARILGLLAKTWAAHTGCWRRSDLLPDAWVSGLEALRCLVNHVQEHLSNLALYDAGDDLWVAARNRQLAAATLNRLGQELAIKALCDLAQWCEEQLIPQWLVLPRIIHYNIGLLQRGRQPNQLLVQTLARVVELEAALMERLGAVLTGLGIQNEGVNYA